MVFRVIARLDVKAPFLVKGIQFEGFRKIGSPVDYAKLYYDQGCDEICYQDVVASLYGRNSLVGLVSATAKDSFVPLSVGGGIRSLEDAETLIRNGADKVLVNTAATLRPALLRELADHFGEQAVVLSVEAKRFSDGWLVMTDSGREHTGKPVSAWVKEAQDLGIGEVILSSIDRDGTKLGFDTDLLSHVRPLIDVPLIAHGGFGKLEDAVSAASLGVDGIAIASVLHQKICSVSDVKSALDEAGIEVRF
jgi:cyclase